jgi:hypothetical protein
LTDDDHVEIDKITKTIESYSKEIEEIATYKINLNKGRFEDVNGGDAVEKLFSTLSEDGIEKVFTAVFAENKIEATEDK